MDRIDLHTHSTASDGSLSPAELVFHAAKLGLRAIALTDHDTTDGLEEAAAAADTAGIELVKGIELAADYRGSEIHIIGLDIDPDNPRFLEKMADIQKVRENRNLMMVDRMAAHGVPITPESLYAHEGSGVLTRTNFASYLVSCGFAANADEALSKYLGDNRPFYIPRPMPSAEDAIALILLAGGIPVLAHPLVYRFTDMKLARLIHTLIPAGLAGIEVYYSANTMADDIRVSYLASKYHLKYAGGSDFHGSYKPHIEIGRGKGRLCMPYDVLEKLRS